MARRPRAARPLLGGRGPAALVARALVSASLGLGRRGRRRTGGSSSRAPPPSTLLGGCPGLLQGPGGGPAGLQTSDGSAPVSRHTGALAPRTHRRQRDHGGTEVGLWSGRDGAVPAHPLGVADPWSREARAKLPWEAERAGPGEGTPEQRK